MTVLELITSLIFYGDSDKWSDSITPGLFAEELNKLVEDHARGNELVNKENHLKSTQK
jgi:hypothetical protein